MHNGEQGELFQPIDPLAFNTILQVIFTGALYSKCPQGLLYPLRELIFVALQNVVSDYLQDTIEVQDTKYFIFP